MSWFCSKSLQPRESLWLWLLGDELQCLIVHALCHGCTALSACQLRHHHCRCEVWLFSAEFECDQGDRAESFGRYALRLWLHAASRSGSWRRGSLRWQEVQTVLGWYMAALLDGGRVITMITQQVLVYIPTPVSRVK